VRLFPAQLPPGPTQAATHALERTLVAHDLSSLVSRLSLSRVGAGGLGLLGIGLTALVTAPTAAAADLGNVTYFCSGSGTVSSSSMAGHVGDTFTITPDPTGGDCP